MSIFSISNQFQSSLLLQADRPQNKTGGIKNQYLAELSSMPRRMAAVFTHASEQRRIELCKRRYEAWKECCPLVSNQVSLATYANPECMFIYPGPERNPVREQIRELAVRCPGIEVRKIRGDGHCLFRAIAAGLFIELARAPNQQRCTFFSLVESRLHQLFYSITSPEYEGAFGQKCDMFFELARSLQNRSPEVILTNPGTSDALVSFMRSSAACCIRSTPQLQAFISGSTAEYCQALERMQPAVTSIDVFNNTETVAPVQMGDELEIRALSLIFGINIRVINIATGNATAYTSPNPIPFPELVLFYLPNPGHYDLACRP